MNIKGVPVRTKGVAKAVNEVARELVLEGFDFDCISELVVKEFEPLTQRQVELYEDMLFEKIEKNSEYLEVTDTFTKEKFYYFTIREIVEDTGMNKNVANSSVSYETNALGRYSIRKKQFTVSEAKINKREMFSKKLGKVEIRKYYAQDARHLDNPLRVIDDKTGLSKIYKSGRSFCNEMKMNTYNLAKYVNNGWKFKRRYKLEKVI